MNEWIAFLAPNLQSRSFDLLLATSTHRSPQSDDSPYGSISTRFDQIASQEETWL
jgi:hypothetical protein